MEFALAAELLDSLEIAVCVFDAEDRTLGWNACFLRLFPEHDGHVHVGEHYSRNLRRFYETRLPTEDLPQVDGYIADAVARHRTQSRPFVFLHRGNWLRVASLPQSDGTRIRIWVQIQPPEPSEAMDGHVQRVLQAVGQEAGQVLVETIADGFMAIDAEGHIAAVNSRFLQLYGLDSKRAAIGMDYAGLLAQLWRAAAQSAPPRTGGVGAMPAEMQSTDCRTGEPFEVELPGGRFVRVIMHQDPDGRGCAIHSDITAMKRHQCELRKSERRALESEAQLQSVAQQLRKEQVRLRKSEERFRRTFLHSGIATGVTLPQGRFVEANPALCTLLHHTAPQLQARTLVELAHEEHRPALVRGLHGLASDRHDLFQLEAPFLRGDGGTVWVALSSTAVRGPEGQLDLLIHHLQDLTARRQAEHERDQLMEQISHQASHDGLTGLTNRRQFEQLVQRSLLELAVPGSVHSLCFLDLDGFKQVNDVAGHAAGDVLLREIAGIFRASVRASDTVSRLGGDEFGLLLQGCQTPAALAAVEKLIASLATYRFEWGPHAFSVGVSAGVCTFGDCDASTAEMVRRADVACYAAKRRGGSGVVVYQPQLEHGEWQEMSAPDALDQSA